MGSAVVKPEGTGDNKAKQDMEQQVKGLEAMATGLFDSIRLGEATDHNLGYSLVGNKMVDQEVKILSQSEQNVTSDAIHKVVHSIFGKDWEDIVDIAADEFIMWLTQTPSDQAAASIFSKSYLTWKNRSLLQVTVYVRKSLWGSSGTLTKDKSSVMLVGLAKGVVAYESIDPQTLIYEVTKSNPNITERDFDKLMQETEQELKRAVKLSMYKNILVSGEKTGAAAEDLFKDDDDK